MKKISKIASLLLVGSTMFIVGCDWSSSSSSSSATGTVSDGYISGAKVCVDDNNDSICEPNEKIIATTNANGRFSIPASYKKSNLATIGGTDTATGELIGALALKGNSGKLNVTPITTFLASFDGNASQAADFLGINEKSLYNDPMNDKTGESTKGTLKLNAAKIISGGTYGSLAATGENNLSAAVKKVNPNVDLSVVNNILSQINDLNVSGNNDTKKIAEQTVVVAAQVAKTGKDANLTQIHNMIKEVDNNVSIKNPLLIVATVTSAVKERKNIKEVITVVKKLKNTVETNSTISQNPDVISQLAQTMVKNPDANITTSQIENAVKKATPITYMSDKITIGNQTVKFTQIPGTNIATFDVEKNLSSVTTYQNFASIKLPDVNASTLEGKDGTYSASLVLTVKDLEGDNTVIFRINNATVNIANKKLSVELIPNQTKLAVYQKGLSNLSKIKSGEVKIADIKTKLVKTGFSVNINTLINDLSTNSDAISTTLAELNTYLIQPRKYKVTLKVNTDLPLAVNTLMGSVNVVNISNIKNEINNVKNNLSAGNNTGSSTTASTPGNNTGSSTTANTPGNNTGSSTTASTPSS